MRNPIKFEMHGMEELERALEELPEAVASRVFGEGLEKAGEVVAAALVSEAPHRSNLLREHFGMSKMVKKLAGRLFIGPIKDVFYPNPRARKDS